LKTKTKRKDSFGVIVRPGYYFDPVRIIKKSVAKTDEDGWFEFGGEA